MPKLLHYLQLTLLHLYWKHLQKLCCQCVHVTCWLRFPEHTCSCLKCSQLAWIAQCSRHLLAYGCCDAIAQVIESVSTKQFIS